MSLQKLTNFPFFVILAAVYPILYLYQTNLDKFTLRDVIYVLFLTLAVVLMIWGIFSAITKKRIFSAFIVLILTLGFFLFGHIAIQFDTMPDTSILPFYIAIILTLL